jgi:hypothetical protein
VYFGDISDDAIFDPSMLSGAVFQVKNRDNADSKAELVLRPIGIPRDLCRPLPYLAFLMELGNESFHRDTKSKIKSTASRPPLDDEFRDLTEQWVHAAKTLKQYKRSATRTEIQLKKLKDDVKAKRLAMDCCNRYSVCVRGATSDVYGILLKADIAREFATLLKITMPSPTDQDSAIQHMRPLERLGSKSHYTAWMSNYVVTGQGDEQDKSDVEDTWD